MIYLLTEIRKLIKDGVAKPEDGVAVQLERQLERLESIEDLESFEASLKDQAQFTSLVRCFTGIILKRGNIL